MISSKRTCIIRKKSSFLLLILISMLLPLSAAEYRVQVVTDDENVASLISSSLQLLSGEVSAPDQVSAYWERDRQERRISEEKTISGYITGEDAASLESYVSPDPPAEDALVLAIAEESFSDTEKSFLYSGDKDAFRYLMRRNNLDLLIAAETADEGLMSELSVYANGELIHQAVYLTAEEAGEFLSITEALLPYLKSDDYLIVPIRIPSNVSVSVDGETPPLVQGMTLLSKGEHQINYTSPAYQSIEEIVIVDEDTVLEPLLEPVFSGPAIVSSVPFDSAIFYQGILIENHMTEDGTVPFSITASAPGFAPYSMQSTRLDDNITLNLRPLWMIENDLVTDAKGRFYTDLLGTLLAFGLNVAANAVTNIYPEYGIAPLAGFFAGVSFVQLIEMVDSMFDYFQAARLVM